MKYLFYTLIYSLGFLNLSAQNCLPDSTLKDSTAGVFPRPITMDNPNGGIKKKACLNKPYDFTFTVVVPDSIKVSQYPTLALDKVFIDTANAIKNLPKGISYMCNPPNCVYKKNTLGCLILKGTALNTDTLGNYKPVIHLTVTLNIGIPYDYSTDYPGPDFPGEYILTLQPENDCIAATNNQTTTSNFWYPNPNQGIIYATSSHIENVKIFNLNGKLIYSKDELRNQNVDLTSLNTEGLHFIHWIEDNHAFVQKIIIRR